MLKTCKTVKPSFFANENLTPRRNTIMYVLRKIKKLHPTVVKGYASYDGKVYAYISPLGPSPGGRDVRVPVNTHASLMKFCDEIVKLPLNNFLDAWNH